MGIGREVADAYIDVHGDLSSFRRDLAGAADDKAMKDAAFANADQFADAWGKRISKDVNGKWQSILDAMYSDKQVDWDRMFGTFDPRSLKDARDQVKDFLNTMRQTEHFIKDSEGERVFAGMKLEIGEAAKMLSRMDEVIAGMNKREQERLDKTRNLVGLQQELADWQEREARAQKVRTEAETEAWRMNDEWMKRRAKTMQEAIDMNKAWARTWEGMRKNNAIGDMEADFKKLAAAMNFADMGKFAKSFDDLDKARARIFEVTAAMEEQGRISRARAQELHDHFQAFMDDQAAQIKAAKDLKDETARLKKVQDDYNKSLDGMVRAANLDRMEGDFKKLTQAIATGDWSNLAKGAKNMEELRTNITRTADEMRRMGRMTDAEFRNIGTRINEASAHMDRFNISFSRARGESESFGKSIKNVFGKLGTIFGRLNTVTQGFRQHLAGFAGLNVFGDMIEGGLEFIHNLDRIAVSLAKNTMLLSSMASVGTSALASLFPIAADLGTTIGGLAAVLPSFAVGAGIGIGVLIAALQDTKTVLADLKAPFQNLQDTISGAFWKQAAGPIRAAVGALMPIFQPQLNNTARELGILVGKLATAFKDIPADAINTMMDRLNESIGIMGDAAPPVIRAFTNLGLVGSKYFARFSTWMVKLSNQFDAFIQKSADNGDLDKWIERMITGFKDLGRVIDGVFGIFNAVNDAAVRAGYGGLSVFADKLQAIARIMQTPEFQTTLTGYLEAARILTEKLGKALYDLGPAITSFLPTAQIVLGKVGDAVSVLIGYIGDIFENPRFQKGVQDFATGLYDAAVKLGPAVQPFADSLGNALSLLGQILVSVAEVAAAFTVTLGPVLDSMSTKIQTLLDPLKETALNFISKMEGPLKALDEQFIAPLVEGFKNNLLPAINGFIDKFGPFAEKVIRDLGPSFKELIDNVLPNLIRLAGELLDPLGGIVDLLSPTLAGTLERIGIAFKNLADAVKVLKGELPITDLWVFKAMDPAKIQADAEEARRVIAHNMNPANAGSVGWDKVVRDALLGAPPGVFWSEVWNMIGPDQAGYDRLAEVVKGIQDKITGDWNDIWSGKLDREFTDILIQWFPGQADFLNGVQGWTDDVFSGKWFVQVKDRVVQDWNDTWKEGGGADQMDADVNNWLDTNVWKPFTKAMNDFGNSIPESFKSDVKEWGLLPAIGNWLTNDVFHMGGVTAESVNKTVNDWFETNVFKPIRDAWDTAFNAVKDWLESGGDHASGNRGDDHGRFDIGAMWNDFWSAPPGGFTDTINTTVNDWFETNFFKPIRDAWDNAWKAVTDWFNSGGNGEGGAGSGRGDNNGQDLWNNFWGGLWSGLGDINSGANDLNKTVNDWLDTNVWKPIEEWFKNIDWAKVGQDLWDGFIKGLTGKTPAEWDKVRQGFEGWLNDVKNFFGIHSPSTVMAEVGQNVIDGFLQPFNVGEWWNGITSAFENIKNTVVTKVQELKDGAAQKWEEFKTGWDQFWGGFGSGLNDIWEGLKSTVTTKWQELSDGVSTKWQEFKTGWDEFWGGFGQGLSDTWEGLKSTVTTKWQELSDGIGTKYEEFKSGWDGFWSDTGTNLSNAWNGFVDTVTGKTGEINTNVNNFATDFGNGWNGFWSDTGTNLGNAWTGFVGTVGDKAGEINTNVNNWAGDVGKNWNNFWGGVGDDLSTNWNNFVGTVQDKAGNIQNDVAGFGNDVSRNWNGFWGGVGGDLTGWWNQFTGTVGRQSDNMSGDVNSMGGDMLSYVRSAMGNLWNELSSSFNNFVNLVMGRVGDIVSWVGTLPGRIMGQMWNLGGLLYGAGQAIMNGFLNGLYSMWGNITSFVGGIANWIAANKGPLDYDAKLLIPAGQAIMGGLDKGLRSQMDPLLTTLQAITASVTDTVTGDLSHSAMYVAGADAAKGLADGLKANKSTVQSALGSLTAFSPNATVNVGGSFAAVGRPTANETAVAAAPSLMIAEGAIKIETPTKDPALVAAKVIDSFVNYSSF